MSLNFDLKEVRERLGEERWADLTTSPETRNKPVAEQKWHPVTDALIWLSMAVDLGSIKESNVDEWCFRLGLLHTLSGPDYHDLSGGIGKFNLNRNDIVNHIGLKTNVTTKARPAFLAKIFGENSGDSQKVALKPTQEPSAAERVNAGWAAYEAKEKEAAGKTA